MAVLRLLIIASAVIFSLSSGLQGFDNVLSNPKECEDSCVKSYSPHTNLVAGGESEACNRGCRLYIISEFVTRGAGLGEENVIASLSTAKESCFSSCVEAYNDTSPNTVACKTGCDHQQQKTKDEKKEAGTDSDTRSIHLLSPLVQVRSVYSSLVGAVHVVRSSLVTYFAAEDNSIVAVESAPEILVEVVGEEGKVEEGREGAMIPPHRPRIMTHEGGEGVRTGGPYAVSRVSQRLGVPPPLLVASALVLVLFTIYVIFAVCTTATPAKARKGGLSVQSDPLPLPIKLVRPEDLTHLSLMEDDDQAPPLPLKVNLPDTHV